MWEIICYCDCHIVCILYILLVYEHWYRGISIHLSIYTWKNTCNSSSNSVRMSNTYIIFMYIQFLIMFGLTMAHMCNDHDRHRSIWFSILYNSVRLFWFSHIFQIINSGYIHIWIFQNRSLWYAHRWPYVGEFIYKNSLALPLSLSPLFIPRSSMLIHVHLITKIFHIIWLLMWQATTALVMKR